MQGGAPVKSLGGDMLRNCSRLRRPKFLRGGCLATRTARHEHRQHSTPTNDACASLAALRPKPQDSEAEIVSEALRTNGAQQSRPTGRRWCGGGGVLRPERSWGRCGAEPSKAVGVAGGDAGCGAAGVPLAGGECPQTAAPRAAWVGRWLRRVVGRMSCDSGVGEGGWPLALLMLRGGRRLGALRPEPLRRR
jgi:hypothetical protein